MALFEDMIQNMSRMGLFQYLFPFLLSFALLYGLMEWVFKGGKLGGKQVHALIAIVLSFFVMLYSSLNSQLYQLLTQASGVWLGIGVVLLLIVLATELLGLNLRELLGGEKGEQNKWIKYAVVLVFIYIVLYAIFGNIMTGFLPAGLNNSDIWTVVLVIIIIGIVFAFVGGKDKEAAPAGSKPV
ncbi:MAG: hypothetical protein V1813_03550 [Candidatus Aenigmatarchaeota archaeon]